MDMNEIMQQAQMMQQELMRAQEEVHNKTFTATAGGGMVSVTAKGDSTIESIRIDPEVVDPDDVEMLQDMVTAAVNSALRSVAEASEQQMASLTGGINLGGLF